MLVKHFLLFTILYWFSLDSSSEKTSNKKARKIVYSLQREKTLYGFPEFEIRFCAFCKNVESTTSIFVICEFCSSAKLSHSCNRGYGQEHDAVASHHVCWGKGAFINDVTQIWRFSDPPSTFTLCVTSIMNDPWEQYYIWHNSSGHRGLRGVPPPSPKTYKGVHPNQS